MKTLAVRVNIKSTACCNKVLVYVLLNQINFKLWFKIGKIGCVCLLNAVHMHPVEWIQVCVVGG